MILITGAHGFVGQKLFATLPDAVAAPSLRDASPEDIRQILLESGADTVIHTAAVSDIGACQADPEGSYRANVLLPLRLAQACQGRKLICFSSDQVYGGSPEPGPYMEDMAAPENLYARQKLEMEQRVLEVLPSAVLLRAEWMFDLPAPKPNFAQLLLTADSLSFSSRQYRGVTWLEEVARNMDAVCRLPGGVYNFGSETSLSMYEITCQLIASLGRDVPVTDAPPRHNLWLNCEKAKKFGISFSPAEEAVRLCLEASGHLPHK